MSGVRINTSGSLTLPTVLIQKNGGAPGEIRTPGPLVRSSKGQENWRFWCSEVNDFQQLRSRDSRRKFIREHHKAPLNHAKVPQPPGSYGPGQPPGAIAT